MKMEVLNPHDPKIYTDPDKVMMLDPGGQLIALLNLARTGQIVRSDEVRTLEALLRNAGYQSDMDGQLSRAELVALEHLHDEMNDTAFQEAGKTLGEMLLGAAGAKAVLDMMTPDHLQPAPAAPPAQQAFARIAKNLFDPD